MRRDQLDREIVQIAGLCGEDRLDPDGLARAPEDRADQSARQMHRRDDRLAEIGRVLRLRAIDGFEQMRGTPGAKAAVAIVKGLAGQPRRGQGGDVRSEEHTSELQSLMRLSYAVFCLKK